MVPSFQRALSTVNESSERIETIFVIGGAEVFDASVEHHSLRYVYVTYIDISAECDRFFKLPTTRPFVRDVHFGGHVLDDGLDIEFRRYYVTPHEELQYLELIRMILDKGVGE